MDNFLVCMNAVLPLFLLMALGYSARCFKLIDRKDVAKFNKLAFRYFLAVSMFYNVYTSDISAAANPKVILYAVIAVLTGFTIGLLYALRFVKDDRQKAVYIQGFYRSNYVLIGLPLAQSLMPDAQLGSVALLVAIVVPIYNMLAVVCLAVFNGQKPDLRKVLKNIATNPLILGSLLGLLFVALGIRLPSFLENLTAQLARCATPLLLFLLGAFFDFNGIGKYKKDLAIICFVRLIAYPAVFLGLAAALGFRGVDFVSMMGIFASAIGVAAFTMVQEMGSDAELMGLSVVFTSALCSFTLFGWSFLFKSLGVF